MKRKIHIRIEDDEGLTVYNVETIDKAIKPRALEENRDFREIEGINSEIDKIFGDKLI